MTKDGTELVAYPGGATASSVTVPTGVTKLRMDSFFSGPVSSVSLPASLQEIQQQVFGLPGLSTIEIPISVSVIGEDAFGASVATISVAAGNPTFRATDGVLFRGNQLFAYPRGKSATTYHVPAGTTAIADVALDRNTSLTSISLPNSLTTFRSNPFRGLSSLESITVETGHPTLDAVDGVLFSDGVLVAYPKAKVGATYSVPAGTTGIGAHAFSGASLTTVNLPESVTAIESQAFAYNPTLENVDLPSGLITLGGFALYYTKVTNVVVPHTVTVWGSQIFGYNRNAPADLHLYFEGDAPPEGAIGQNSGATIHRIEGTGGWPAISDPFLGYTQIAWNPNITTPGAPSGVALAESVRVTARRGSGGLPTSYRVESSPGNATCTILVPDVSCVVTGLTAGTAYTFTTRATRGQTTTAWSSVSAIVRPLATQTIAFAGPIDRHFSSTPFVVTATSDANVPVVLTSTTLDVCTVSEFEVTMVSEGTCTLNANAAGNSSYAEAIQVTRSFEISEPPTTAPTTTAVLPPALPALVNVPVATTTTTTVASPPESVPSTTAPTDTAAPTTEAPATTTPAPALSVVRELPVAPSPIVADPTLAVGGEVTVTFGGFTPFEFVQLIVASTPQVIGSGYADAQGVVTIRGAIPADLAAGAHTVAVYAPTSGVGYSQPIQVTAPRLPATGSNDQGRLLVLALMLLSAGPLVRRARFAQSV